MTAVPMLPSAAVLPSVGEADRAAALSSYNILDTPPEAAFDDITRLAASICNTSVALVSLLDGERQWFKSRVGLDRAETPIAVSFCAHAVREPPCLFVVSDAAQDARFRGNPLVSGESGIRFYAGAVLETAVGVRLGTLCVLDTHPRPNGVTPQQAEALQALARQVVAQLELRRIGAERAEEARRLHLLNRIGAALGGELDLERLVQTVTDAGCELTGAAFGAFFYNRVNEAGESYMLYTLSGAPREAFAAFPMPRNTAIFGPTFAGEGVVRSDDITQDPRYGRNAPYHGMPEGHLSVRSYLAVPVVSRSGEVLGGLFFGHPEAGMFSARQEEMLVAIAAHAAVAIDNARLFEAAQREIERRREAEAALRESEDHLRHTVELNPQVPWTASPNGDILDFSDRWLALTGLSREQALGRGWADVAHPEDLPGMAQSWADSVRTGDPYDVEHRVRTADGGHRWMRSRAAARRSSPDGTVLRWYGTTEDIHDRKTAEAALRESETKSRAITEAMPQIVWSTRPDGFHDYYNRRWYDYTGTAPGQTDGEGWADMFHPEDRPEARCRWRHALASGEPYEVEYRLRAADGQWRWFLGRALPIRDEATGAVVRWFGTCTDIDDAVRARETLQRSAEDLERMVADRTRRLEEEQREREAAQEQLRQAQKMEAVGQLTGGIAHDFNNMLTGIVGSLELIRTRSAQGRYGDVERFVLTAMTSANRAAALTHRLLAFSRRQTLDPKPTDANKLVASMEDLIRRTVGEAIRVEAVLAGGLWCTLCDANQLESALLNLVINARDAMPDGGRLTIESCNAHLDGAYVAGLPDVEAGQYVCLAVTDTGTGMEPDLVGKVFEPFFTTKPIGQGTGLGLSMVYGFVKQSGGHIRLYSEPGRGTTVKLYLPRHVSGGEDERTADEGVPREAVRAAADETVLVVEDDPAVRMLMVEVLGELGYAVREASDGPAGLRIAESGARIDLLVTDVGLPGMNGRQLADAARRLRPALQVLFITGYAHNAALGNGFLERGMHVISKPFAMAALAAKVRDLVGQVKTP